MLRQSSRPSLPTPFVLFVYFPSQTFSQSPLIPPFFLSLLIFVQTSYIRLSLSPVSFPFYWYSPTLWLFSNYHLYFLIFFSFTFIFLIAYYLLFLSFLFLYFISFFSRFLHIYFAFCFLSLFIFSSSSFFLFISCSTRSISFHFSISFSAYIFFLSSFFLTLLFSSCLHFLTIRPQ